MLDVKIGSAPVALFSAVHISHLFSFSTGQFYILCVLAISASILRNVSLLSSNLIFSLKDALLDLFRNVDHGYGW